MIRYWYFDKMTYRFHPKNDKNNPKLLLGIHIYIVFNDKWNSLFIHPFFPPTIWVQTSKILHLKQISMLIPRNYPNKYFTMSQYLDCFWGNEMFIIDVFAGSQIGLDSSLPNASAHGKCISRISSGSTTQFWYKTELC